MISFCSSANWSADRALSPCPSCSSFSADPLGRLFALAEDLLEMADLGEEHVARGPPRLAVRADVLGPEEVGDELVGHGLERFEVEQVLGAARGGSARLRGPAGRSLGALAPAML